MIVYHHEHKDRVVLELEEKEFNLISFLLERAAQKYKDKLKESLSEEMSNQLLDFMDENN